MRTAAISIPTLRGDVELSFEFSARTFAANLTVPGNTWAEVCLPVYLFAEPSSCHLKVLAAVQPLGSRMFGALLCLEKDLGGGVHQLLMQC
eukprot:SAG31_NODE_247_length_19134_cov_12.255050_7_plen_91_part_00